MIKGIAHLACGMLVFFIGMSIGNDLQKKYFPTV